MFKRGKRTYLSKYSTKDIFKVAKEKHGFSGDLSEFSDALDVITNHIFNIILYDSGEYKFTRQLGSIRIKNTKFKLKLNEDGSVKKNQLKVNFKASKELWKEKYPDKTWEEIKNIPNKPLVYFLNKHSNGKYNKFYWDKRASTVKNQSIYKLDIIRPRRIELSELSKQNKIYYA